MHTKTQPKCRLLLAIGLLLALLSGNGMRATKVVERVTGEGDSGT